MAGPRCSYRQLLHALQLLHAAVRCALGRRGHLEELCSGAMLQTFARQSHARRAWCLHVQAVIILYRSIKQSSARRPVVLKMTHLLPISLLSSLHWGDVFQIAIPARLQGFKSGDIIIKNRDSGDSMFVMLSGQVGITITLPNGNELTVAHLREGAAFGEMSLLTGAPRGATVSAEEDAEAIEIRWPRCILWA